MKSSANFLLAGGPKKEKKKPVPISWIDRVPHQDYEGLRDTFNLFDEDGSGKIDPI